MIMSRIENKTYELTVKGLVQGVGYRPYVAELLRSLGINGVVQNTGGIVKICITAADRAVEDLLHRLYKYYPEGAVVESISVREVSFTEFSAVEIITSDIEESIPVLPADLCICPGCIEELRNPKNRRYKYPFISCAGCGPRYTIMHRIPYDRENTTMQAFDMCEKCAGEYLTPGDRRYYAQTISCPDCGPQLYLEHVKKIRETQHGLENAGVNSKDCKIQVEQVSDMQAFTEYGTQAFESAVTLLKAGEVIAVKNTGGYHLVCDAFSEVAVSRLRRLKKRDKKPFAVMVSDLEKAGEYALINEREANLLTENARPIVLLKKRKSEGAYENTDCTNKEFSTSDSETAENVNKPAYSVSMESSYIGIMLPSNGLQVMLSDEFEMLVMTSANISGEPMITCNKEIRTLGVPVLGNDREILTPADDSVVSVVRGKTQFLRRGRGFVPAPIETGFDFGDKTVFASGADMKAAFAYGTGNRVYLSQYLGDLSHKRVQQEYLKTKARMEACFNLKADEIIMDKHPLYFSRKLGEFNQPDTVKKETYHHYAHMAAVMVEHGIEGDALGFSFDGTGYGEDGTIWGGEIFRYSNGKFSRVGCLKPVKMPGGDSASEDAEIPLAAYFYDALNRSGDELSELPGISFLCNIAVQKEAIGKLKEYDNEICGQTKILIEKQDNLVFTNKNKFLFKALDLEVNTVINSSAGRVFDAVAALLEICNYNGYEGQCPSELEYAAVRGFEKLTGDKADGRESDEPEKKTFADESEIFEKLRVVYTKQDGMLIADTPELICRILAAVAKGVDADILACRFHEAIADFMVSAADALVNDEKKEIVPIVLSGGVFANRFLTEMVAEKLENKGYNVFFSEKVPPGDDGIALGQLFQIENK